MDETFNHPSYWNFNMKNEQHFTTIQKQIIDLVIRPVNVQILNQIEEDLWHHCAYDLGGRTIRNQIKLCLGLNKL